MCRTGVTSVKNALNFHDNTDNSKGLILAASPLAKEIFESQNVTRSWDSPKHHPRMKDLIITPPRMTYYIEMNMEIQEVLRRFASDDDILWYSIDEGVADLTQSLNYFEPDAQLSRAEKLDRVSKRIQEEIYYATGIYSTVGMSNSNPLLAKLAFDNGTKKKKNMRDVWNYEDVPTKVRGIQEMTDFWGIGGRTKERLNRLGIFSIQELALLTLTS